jgi:far upstream element-binding protein
LVIGRSGENLRRVEQETTARIQFITPPDHAGPSRQCRISGNPRARSEAKNEIFRIIEENNMQGPQGRGPGNRPPKNAPPPRDAPVGEDSLKIMVPDRTVGLIIGRGGETIRDLQERSGCHINIVAANKSVNGLRPVNLIGSPQAAQKAKDFIMEIVESDTRGPQQNDSAPQQQYQAPSMHEPSKNSETIRVPSDAVGMIIGKGGETIRDMQNSTGCKINVSQASGADIEREIGLVGNRQAIEAAKRAIQDKVDTVVRAFISAGLSNHCSVRRAAGAPAARTLAGTASSRTKATASRRTPSRRIRRSQVKYRAPTRRRPTRTPCTADTRTTWPCGTPRWPTEPGTRVTLRRPGLDWTLGVLSNGK